ncbi:MAG: GTPase [Planctomycetota bacterium]
MLESFAGLVTQTQEWFERATTAGWFAEAERRRFAAIERATPADLFTEGQMRPLVIALFGGTGVGKSSLLNRLAGIEIARVGVERPTSRDVTLYLHESVQLADLPENLPLDRVVTRTHNSALLREVLWIDAPDIDSVEETNRQCAFAWLPHVDLVCYVVSPERYRDDIGWQVLKQRGHKHGWMFVMNRWDEGDAQQPADFTRMLQEAGFSSPLLLRTCCRPDTPRLPSPDEFEQMRATIRELLEAHAVRELARLGHRARLRELRLALEGLQGCFGDEGSWEKIRINVRDSFRQTRAQLMQGAGWSMQNVAARFAIRDSGVVNKVVRQVAGVASGKKLTAADKPAAPAMDELHSLTEPLWDDWSQTKVEGCLDAIEVAAGRTGIRVPRLRQQLERVSQRARSTVMEHIQDHVRAALMRPGSLLVRTARRITGFLTTLLPAAALTWVALKVVERFYHNDFVAGADFAWSSALLVLVAWLLPFLIDRMLRPSTEQTVLRALRQGFGSGCEALAVDFDDTVEKVMDEAHEFRGQAQTLSKATAGLMIKPLDPRNPTLARLIANNPAEA